MRGGNTVAGPETEIKLISEGVADLERRWTYLRQEMGRDLPGSPKRGRLGRVLVLPILGWNSGTYIYWGGAVFRAGEDGAWVRSGHPDADAPCHPNDPVRALDLLCGAQTCRRVPELVRAIPRSIVALTGTINIETARRSAPHGLASSIGTPVETELPFVVWLDPDERPVRISLRHQSPAKRRADYWSATEFSDYGVSTEELWTGTVAPVVDSRAPGGATH